MRLSQLAGAANMAPKELVKKFYCLRKGAELKIAFLDETYCFITPEGRLALLDWSIEVVELGYKIVSPDRSMEVEFSADDVEYSDGQLAVRDWGQVMVASGWGTAVLREIRGNGERKD
jgi:hypothetical protein